MKRSLVVEALKLAAIVAVFAFTIPMLVLGKWLMLGAYTSIMWAGRLVQR